MYTVCGGGGRESGGNACQSADAAAAAAAAALSFSQSDVWNLLGVSTHQRERGRPTLILCLPRPSVLLLAPLASHTLTSSNDGEGVVRLPPFPPPASPLKKKGMQIYFWVVTSARKDNRLCGTAAWTLLSFKTCLDSCMGGAVIIQTNYSETLASDHRLCSLPFARKVKDPCGFVMYGKKADGDGWEKKRCERRDREREGASEGERKLWE